MTTSTALTTLPGRINASDLGDVLERFARTNWSWSFRIGRWFGALGSWSIFLGKAR